MAQGLKPINLFVLGGRGIPEVPGGVETHCQELYPRIAESEEIKVTILGRSPYIGKEPYVYKKVSVKPLYSPKKASIEAIVHSFIGVIYARLKGCDILHIHAIGPSLVVPFAKMLRLKVVVTHHGPDYDRQKWGKEAKFMLQRGERNAAKFADKIIVISNVIANILKEKYNRDDTVLIYNGVNTPVLSIKTDYIKSLGLKKKEYIIAVGRFVEEKGFHDLIEAYKKIDNPRYKLVLVGDADHQSEYSRKLKVKAKENNVVLTGFIRGEKLNEIFSHASLFVMPSYHEGLPIALLEALSYKLEVLVSNIPANKEVGLTPKSYFETGSVVALYEKLLKILDKKLYENYEEYNYKLLTKYEWNSIAVKTSSIYFEMI